MASRKIEDLLPVVQPIILLFEQKLREAGLSNFKRSCTYRAQLEQDALWLRGRVDLDKVNSAYKHAGLAPITAEENKRPVTWKQVSDHSLRKAVDYYEEIAGKASYDIKVDIDDDQIPDWMEFGKIAEECGLRWGGRFKTKDYAHVEYDG